MPAVHTRLPATTAIARLSPAGTRDRGGREALVLAAWLLLSLAWRPLALPDEGRYAGVAFEMLAQHSLVPLLDGLPFFHKPPLLYALDMAAMAVLGVHPFAARLGPALCGWAMGMALFLHLRHAHGVARARLGLAALATMPFFFFGAQYVNHDIGVAACITGTVLAAVHALDTRSRRWFVAAWALGGLGVLAKGLIGLVLPALVLAPWLAAQRRWRDIVWLLHPAGGLAALAVAGPWLAAMELRHPGFAAYFIVEQHFRRYAESGFNNHQPFWFYAALLPLLALPWSAWLLPVVRAAGARQGLYAWWIVVVLGFFSLPASKLAGYVMPALPPLAALVALALDARGTPWRRVACAAAIACLAACALLAWRAPGSHADVARALAARWRPGDRLVYADEAFYDVRVLARVSAPALILSDWDDPGRTRADDWRKELADAARFDPEAASTRLWPWRRLAELGCGSGRTWVVADRASVARLGALPGLHPVAEGRHALLLGACGG